MGGVGDGSMGSPPKIEYLPLTENDDGSMGVDISNLENPDVTISASVNSVARYCRREKKELRVKLPCYSFKFIALLSRMGFSKIQPAESTESYIVLKEDKSLQMASGVTLMQRENIASSSKPCNLICNQTLDATLAVQTPWEQGPEFQHSSGTFPSGPAGMKNDNEGAGLQGFSVTPEIPECGEQTKKRRHPANESELPSKRRRGPDFGDKEKGLLLRFKLEYLQDSANEGKSHKWLIPVTERMKDNGYDRDSAAWRGLCDTLKKSFDAVRQRWSPQDTSYWDLTMDQKKAIKKKNRHFPLTFGPECYVAMENIEKLEPRCAAKKETRRDGQEGVFSQSLASTITCSAKFAGAGSSSVNSQASVQHPRQASAQGSDEDLLVNLQRPGAPLACIQEFASFSHSLRKKDYQDMSFTMEEQVAVQRELTGSASKKSMEITSSDSLGALDDALLQYFVSDKADADLAGCNEWENQE